MSMFGAVDLSSLAPATKPTGSTSGASPTTGDRPTGAAGSGLPVPLVVDVDASNLRDVAEERLKGDPDAEAKVVEILARAAGELKKA